MYKICISNVKKIINRLIKYFKVAVIVNVVYKKGFKLWHEWKVQRMRVSFKLLLC